jgi:hypothetical protein
MFRIPELLMITLPGFLHLTLVVRIVVPWPGFVHSILFKFSLGVLILSLTEHETAHLNPTMYMIHIILADKGNIPHAIQADQEAEVQDTVVALFFDELFCF